MYDLGLLILRLTVGTLVAGHGSQKLFGWFKGPGLKRTHAFVEKMGMRPGKLWGTLLAISESGGGLLTALGLLSPLGSLGIGAVMAVAIRRAHWNKPVWAAEGGAELPLTNLATVTALALTGPGRFSLDYVFGLRIPRWITGLMAASGITITTLILQRPDIAESLLNQFLGKLPTKITHPAEEKGQQKLEAEPSVL